MKQCITIESTFDGRSHHGSFRQHLWHRWKWWLVLRSIVCIALICIGAYMSIHYAGKGEKLADFIAIALILMGSVGFIRPMIWQMWSERKLRKHPAYGSKITYSFGSEEITMDGISGKVVVPWCALSEVVATRAGILLYQNKKDYIWIPAQDFKDGEMKEIVSWHEATSIS